MSKVKSITPLPPADFTPELGNYKTLQPFRYWCQKVLPLVYDDTLSYYELLCKVVDYLNKTMEDVETLNGDVTDLHTAYEELQSYVNSYFSSLDVQQEIDNKLDEMASSGELATLLSYAFNDMFVNVKQFGAKGDGITDDTDAFNKAMSKTGYIFIPNGNYVINTGLEITSDIYIIGKNATLSKTLLKQNTNTYQNRECFFHINGGNLNILSGIHLELNFQDETVYPNCGFVAIYGKTGTAYINNLTYSLKGKLNGGCSFLFVYGEGRYTLNNISGEVLADGDSQRNGAGGTIWNNSATGDSTVLCSNCNFKHSTVDECITAWTTIEGSGYAKIIINNSVITKHAKTKSVVFIRSQGSNYGNALIDISNCEITGVNSKYDLQIGFESQNTGTTNKGVLLVDNCKISLPCENVSAGVNVNANSYKNICRLITSQFSNCDISGFNTLLNFGRPIYSLFTNCTFLIDTYGILNTQSISNNVTPIIAKFTGCTFLLINNDNTHCLIADTKSDIRFYDCFFTSEPKFALSESTFTSFGENQFISFINCVNVANISYINSNITPLPYNSSFTDLSEADYAKVIVIGNVCQFKLRWSNYTNTTLSLHLPVSTHETFIPVLVYDTYNNRQYIGNISGGLFTINNMDSGAKVLNCFITYLAY